MVEQVTIKRTSAGAGSSTTDPAFVEGPIYWWRLVRAHTCSSSQLAVVRHDRGQAMSVYPGAAFIAPTQMPWDRIDLESIDNAAHANGSPTVVSTLVIEVGRSQRDPYPGPAPQTLSTTCPAISYTAVLGAAVSNLFALGAILKALYWRITVNCTANALASSTLTSGTTTAQEVLASAGAIAAGSTATFMVGPGLTVAALGVVGGDGIQTDETNGIGLDVTAGGAGATVEIEIEQWGGR